MKKLLRPKTQRLPLEERIVFDAALPSLAADAIDAASTEDLALHQADQQYFSPQNAPTNSIESIAALFNNEAETQTDDAKRTLIEGTLAPTDLNASEIIFIDASVIDLEQYLLDRPNADVVLLDPNTDGMVQIAAVLEHRTDIESIHILSHGSAGNLVLGNAVFNEATMNGKHADALQIINNALTDNADIIIYGCNFAEGTRGTLAVNTLSTLTGADIAASDNATGSANLGGDWELEHSQGTIEAATHEIVALFSTWEGLLATDLQATSSDSMDGGLSINNDGGDDTYLVADDGGGLLGGLSAFTYEIQYSSTDVTGNVPLLSYNSPSTDNELLLLIDTGGNLTFRIDNVVVASSGMDYHTLSDGNVHSIAATWDNTAGDWAFYVDGAVQSSGTNLKTGYTLDAGGALVFGQEQDSVEGGFASDQIFSGTLHDVRLFNDVRTASEIAASYLSDLPYGEQGMIANWKFDQLSSDGVVIEAVSGNNLTVKHVSETGFTSSEPTLTFAVDENALDGTVVGQVGGIDAEREAQIAALLAADPDLRYNAATGKFYKGVSTTGLWSSAQTAAEGTALNGVNGQLVTIRSAFENEIVREIADNDVGNDVWIGATDSTVEGQWRWVDGGSEADLFWLGDETGYNVSGAYHNFSAGQPNDAGGNEDVVRLDDVTGEWLDADHDNHNFYGYVVEWDADAVLDTTQALTYSIQSQTVAGTFKIDASTGKITVADGTLLDYETNASHTLTIRTTDVDSNTHDKAFTVSLNNLAESNNAPSDLSSGIELNSDGGNDAYLVASNGGAVLGGLTELTFETSFTLSGGSQPTFISYASSGQQNEFMVFVGVSGNVVIYVDGVFEETSVALTDINDGQPHSLAVSWDNTNGDWAIYLNGSLADHGTALAAGQTLDAGGTLIFGQEQDSLGGGFESVEAFQGTLYDVRIWNEVRSKADIALNYQQKFDSGSLPTGLVANWQMDGFNGSNEVVDVVSGNNLNIGVVRDITAITTWTDQTGGASASGSTITFVDDGQGTWGSEVNSATFSSMGFNDNYTLSFNLDNLTNFGFVIGLGVAESPANFGDVDYKMYFDHNFAGSVAVYENGSATGTYALGYSAGDAFSFYVNGSTIEYQHNGVTFHTATGVTPASDWYVDSAFHADAGSYANQADYSLSDFRLFQNNIEGTTATQSTSVGDLHISETATDGTSVGFVVPSDPDTPQDIVTDGGFLASDTGAWTDYTQGQTLGGWTVESGAVSHTSQYESPLGGVGLELQRVDGDFPSAITQTLTTEVGKTYQLVFNMTGNFTGGDPAKHLVASAGGVSENFSVTNTANSGYVYEPRSLTFTADSTSTVLRFASGADDGWAAVISDVRVVEVSEAINLILNNDPTLSYDAGTGKFYRFVNSTVNFEVALAAATSATLNGVSGQLLTVRSEYENELFREIVVSTGNQIWLGTSDSTTPGTWNWLEGGVESNETFWTGGNGGSQVNGEYASTMNLSDLASEIRLRIQANGDWGDFGNNGNFAYVIEWDASQVLSSFTFSLTDDAGGRFAINSNTGEITVADGSQIDFEAATSHNVTVQVSDAVGESYSEVMAITVDNELDANQTVPGPQTIDEDTTLTFTAGTATEVSVTDSLSGTNSLMQVSLSVNNGSLTLSQTTALTFVEGSNASGSFIINGTESDINAALDGMTFTPDANFNGSVTLNMTTSLGVNLEGHYEFDGNANDTSAGTLQNGTLAGNATTVIDPQRGEVLSLDGNTDFVEINSLFGSPANVTLAAWVNLTAKDSYGSEVISIGGSVGLRLDGGAGVHVFFWDGSLFHEMDTNVYVAGTGWRHVAFTMDDAGDVQTIYIDGVAVMFGNATESISYNLDPVTHIGSHTSNSFIDFNGLIDDARIYTRALSADEIAALAADQTKSSDNVTITVNPVNDAPILTQAPGGGTYFENNTGTFVDVSTTVTDADNLDFDGGVLTTGITNNGEADDRLIVRHEGTGAGQVNVVGSTIQIDGVQIATISGGVGVGDDLLITFNANADAADVQNVARRIAFNSVSENPSTAQRTISTTLTDGDGGSSATDTRVMNFIAVNDDPTNAGSLPSDITVTEDVLSNVNLSAVDFSDVDAGVSNLTVTLSTSTGGELTLAADGNLTFGGTATERTITGTLANLNAYFNNTTNIQYLHGTPNTVGDNADTITVVINDNGNTGNGGGADQTLGIVNVDITAVNDAPVLDNSGTMTLATITEDDADNAGQTVASIIASAGGDRITDVDSGALEGIAIVSGSTANIARQYSIDGGSTWNFFGTPSATSSILLRSTDLVRIYTITNNGSTGDAFSFRAWDQTTGNAGDRVNTSINGGTTAFSTDTETVAYTITSVNDAPVLDNSSNLRLPTITEDEVNNGGQTVAQILASDGGTPISDADSGSLDGIAITTRNNGRGIWEYSTDGGTNWSSVGTVSETQALLLRATDMVRFAPDGQNGNPTDRTFEFRAWDQTSGTAGTKVDTTTNGGSTAFSTAIESVSITTTDVNDAPVLDNSANLTLNSQAEDAGSPVGAVGTVITDLVSVGGNVTDVDASSQTGVAITAADTSNGTWWYTTDSGTTWNALGAVSESSARVLNAASNTRIYFQSNADHNGTLTNAITFRAWDRSVGSNGSLQDTSTNGGKSPFSVVSETADITITAVNDAPFITVTGGSTTYTENDPPTLIEPSLGISDIDSADFDTGVLTVQITGNAASEDRLSIRSVGTGAGQVSVSGSDVLYEGTTVGSFAGGSGATQLQITFNSQASSNAVDAIGKSMEYFNISEQPSTLTRTISFTVTDGDGGTSNTAEKDILITAVNDAPVVGTNTGALVAEGGTVTITNAMLNEADVDDAGAGLTYTVTSGPTNGQLELTTNLGIAITSFTQNDIDNNRVIFVHDGTQASVDSFDFSLADGGEDGATPATGTFNFTVTNVNDAPVAAGIEGTALAYTENDGAVAITSTISFTDVDDTHIESAVVQITSNHVSSEDVLSFSTQNGISGVYNSTNGTLSLTGSATLAQYETAIRSITYTNTSENPNTGTRTVSFTVNDGDANSNTATREIAITSVNNAPVIGTNTGATVTEGGSVTITNAMLNEADVDDAGAGLTYTVNSGPTNGQLELTTNPSVAITSFTQDDIDNNRVVFVHDGTQASVDSFDFSLADDGEDGATPATGTFNFTVTNVNDAPVNTVPGAQTVDEDTSINITGISVTDVDDNLSTVQLSVNNGTLNVALSGGAVISSGANGAGTLTLSGPLADINATLASLSYQGNQDFVGSDTLTVLSTDSTSATDSDTVTITVNAVADAPVNTVPASVSVNEDTTFAFTGLNLISVADAETDVVSTQLSVSNGTLSVTLSGSAAISAGANNSNTLTVSGTQAEINATLASLTYTGNTNVNGADTLIVLSTDATSGTALTDSDTVTITVNAVADAPVNTVPASVSVNEDTAFAFTGPNLISVADAESDVVSTQLTVSNGTLSVILSGSAAISAGANSSNTLTVSGTQAEINATLASLTYTGNTNFNGADTLTVLSTDATSGTPLTDADVVNITVNGIPENFTVSIPEGPIINAAEITSDGGVLVTINLPIDAVAGDVITLTIDGSAPISYVVTSTDVANNVAAVLLPTNDVLAVGQGSAVITTTYTNAIGNSATPVITHVTIDTVAPATTVNPVGDSVKNAADVTNSAGIITVNGETGTTSVITLTGQTGTINKTVTNTGTSVPVVLSDSDLGILGDGLVDVSVVTTDTAGNETVVPDLADGDFILDTTAPAIPIASLDPLSDLGITGDRLTNDNTPTISGIGGTLGDVIKLFDSDGNILGTTIVGENGTWSITPSSPQPDGISTLTITATDPAGNVSPEATIAITIDTVAPVVNQTPDMTDETDTEIKNDNITSNARPSFAIPAIAPDERPILYIDGLIINAVHDANANTLTPVNPLMTGQYHASYRLEDAAGNLSDNSPVLVFEVKNSNDVLFEQLVSDPEKTNNFMMPTRDVIQASISTPKEIKQSMSNNYIEVLSTKRGIYSGLDLSSVANDDSDKLNDDLIGLTKAIDPSVFVQNAIHGLNLSSQPEVFVEKAVTQSQTESQLRNANLTQIINSSTIINNVLDPFAVGVKAMQNLPILHDNKTPNEQPIPKTPSLELEGDSTKAIEHTFD